jgi:hypothetical protein
MRPEPTLDHWMHDLSKSNKRSLSTNRHSGSGTLREPPPAQDAQSGRRPAAIRLAARDSRKPLTVSVRFVGNGDCEWVLEARGKRYKAAGCENVHEVLQRLSRASW